MSRINYPLCSRFALIRRQVAPTAKHSIFHVFVSSN
jgi:hypothetical protein